MADLSQLGNLAPSQQLDLNVYKDAKGGVGFPSAGEYVLRTRESFPAAAFGATQAGNLKVSLDPTIMGPTNEGFQLRFCEISAKVFDRNGSPASYIADYLRSVGYRGDVPAEPQPIADLLEGTAGATFSAYLDWEARRGDFGVKGMKNFPIDAKTGEHQSWIEHPTEKDAEGNPLRLRANLRIKRFIVN